MNGMSEAREGLGLRLELADKTVLTLGATELQISNPTSKKAVRNSCAPFLSGSNSNIPLYNILWADCSGPTIQIDYALQTSKTTLKTQKFTASIANADEDIAAATATKFATALRNRAYGEAQQKRRALILINPNSGPGNALRHWQTEIKPLFDAARMKGDSVTLKAGGQATEIAEKINIEDYDTIVSCSGDGTPHEIFNGLGNRSDANEALSRIAVGHVPCGSGNALACNLYGSCHPSVAALGIVKGVVTPMDLASITQGSKRTLSFLSQALGIIAESDLGTENLRWMGNNRFTVGLMMRVFKRKCYPLDLAMKVRSADKDEMKAVHKQYKATAMQKDAEDLEEAFERGSGLPSLKYGTINDEIPADWEKLSTDTVGNFYASNMPYIAPNAKFFNAALPSDGCVDLMMVNGTLNPITALKTLMAGESDDSMSQSEVSYRKLEAYRITPRDQKDGYISIDGEKMPFEPFQVEVHRGLGRVISRRGAYEDIQ